jgi:hypothetical protein
MVWIDYQEYKAVEFPLRIHRAAKSNYKRRIYKKSKSNE